jgi:hypothetical protein
MASTDAVNRAPRTSDSEVTGAGVPDHIAKRIAGSFTSGSAANQGSSAGHPHTLLHQVQLGFAQSTQTVFYCMAAVMVGRAWCGKHPLTNRHRRATLRR